jgi:hypothetical protein
MTTIIYNPLTYSDKLIESGMNEMTAKVIAQHEAEFASSMINDNLVTKEDVKEILKGLAVIRNDINVIEYKMTIKFGMMMVAGVGILTFLLKHV